MQLDRLSAVIRPRSPWEGLDLGFAMARQWFPALFGLWCLTALPVGVLGAFWLAGSPSLWLLLVWWLKPLYEAPLLFWLSRRLFGEVLTPRGLWRVRRRILSPRLLPNLLWRRLHPSRSFQMPLLLLENLRGRERRRRQSVLQGRGGTAAWLTVICVHLESILWISALLLIVVLIPDGLPGFDLSAAFTEEGSAAYWISTLVYWAAMSVIAPFYVAAGFAFYLARRTELEAWDLELQFQQAGEVLPPRRRPATAGTASAMLAVCLCLASFSQQAPAVALTREEAKEEIGAVLNGTDFGTTREVQTWAYVESEAQPADKADLPDWILSLLRSLGSGAELAAIIVKWGLILAAAVLLLVILLRVLQQLPNLRPVPQLSGRPASLPRPHAARSPRRIPMDVSGTVHALIAAGDLRGALALLYAASIDLLGRDGLEIPESATELECLALVQATRSVEESQRMQRLVGSWQRLAYAHQVPSGIEIDRLMRDWGAWEEGAADAG